MKEVLHEKIKNKFRIYRRQTPLTESGNPELVQNMRTKFGKKAKQTASTPGTQTSTTPSSPTISAALV
jgi:hypothetical protein